MSNDMHAHTEKRARTHAKTKGYQPDGFINHHHGGCADTAMTAYGFEWLTEMIDVCVMLRDTRFSMEEIPGWLDFPARVLTYTYSRILYKGQIDFAFTGRGACDRVM